ncbi:Hypothetical protein ABZS17H1_03898 [Kosakonia cowanii]
MIALSISAWTMPDRAPYKAEQEKSQQKPVVVFDEKISA